MNSKLIVGIILVISFVFIFNYNSNDDDFEPLTQDKVISNSNLTYSYYNYTTDKVTYKKSNHKVYNVIN